MKELQRKQLQLLMDECYKKGKTQERKRIIRLINKMKCISCKIKNCPDKEIKAIKLIKKIKEKI